MPNTAESPHTRPKLASPSIPVVRDWVGVDGSEAATAIRELVATASS